MLSLELKSLRAATMALQRQMNGNMPSNLLFSIASSGLGDNAAKLADEGRNRPFTHTPKRSIEDWLAHTVIYADLIAEAEEIDLAEAIARRINEICWREGIGPLLLTAGES